MLDDGLITPQQFEAVSHFEKAKPVSLHRDLRVLLYAGILLFITGLGIFIYENIDSIGHITVIILTGAGCLACFAWCFKHTPAFSLQKVQSPSVLFDYILLLGCLLLLTFTGYIQFRYHVFGNSWGLATFVPMVLLFLTAYYFDHLGVLSLAITNLAAWAGITVTPLQLLQANDFSSSHLIYTGIALGGGLILIALTTAKTHFKAHFAFTYTNFGTHILLTSCLAGMAYFNDIYLWFLIVLVSCDGFICKRHKRKVFLLYSSYPVVRLYCFKRHGYSPA